MEPKGCFKRRSELIEFLACLGASGRLLLVGEDVSLECFVRQGVLYALDLQPKGIDERLGTLLVRAQAISPAALLEGLELQEREDKPLGVLLCQRKHLTKDALNAFLRKQYLTQLELLVSDFSPLDYTFDAFEEMPDTKGFTPHISLKEFAHNTGAWLDVPPRSAERTSTLRQRQDMDAFLAASKVLPATTQRSQKETLRDWQNEIGVCERAVYDLSTGEHDLDEICVRLPYSPQEVRVALGRLLDANLVRWQKKSETKTPASLVDELWRERKPFLAYRFFSFVLAFGFLAAMFYLSSGKESWAMSWFGTPVERLVTRASVKDEISAWQMNKIRFALELYHAEEGNYPASLEALVLRNSLRFEDLAYPWRHHYAYIRSEEGYEVLKPIY